MAGHVLRNRAGHGVIRKVSDDAEIDRAVRMARLDPTLPQHELVSIEDLAAVCPRYWGVREGLFKQHMLAMAPEDLEALLIKKHVKQNGRRKLMQPPSRRT